MNYSFRQRASKLSEKSFPVTKAKITISTQDLIKTTPLSLQPSQDGGFYSEDAYGQLSALVPSPEGGGDKIRYFNETYDPTVTDFNTMIIFINGEARALVTYTVDREGTAFMYACNDKTYRGVFTNGDVFF
jgi:hypothetical protein